MKKLIILIAFAGVVFAGCDWDNNNGDTKRKSEIYGHSNSPAVKDSIRRMDQPTTNDKPRGKKGQK